MTALTDSLALEIFTAALGLAFKLSVPLLVVALVVGLIIAILQAATQVHEQTLTFAPKLIAIALALLALGPWMMNEVIDFMEYIFELMATTPISG